MRRLVAIMAVVWMGGCLTSRADGHADACSTYRDPNARDPIVTEAGFDHDACVYAPPTLPEWPDPDAYERGYAAGFEDCAVGAYADAWLAADEAAPCTDVDGDPP